jgi:2-dehydropantoate 2-reductase
VVEANLERAHWEKLVWNIPFNGLGVAGAAGFEAVTSGRLAQGRAVGKCLTTLDLLSEARWEQRVRELMLETIAAARALGLEVPDSIADKQIERTRQMGAYKASTLLDFEAGRELELESLFLEPRRQATKADVSCPRLGALCALLSQMAAMGP